MTIDTSLVEETAELARPSQAPSTGVVPAAPRRSRRGGQRKFLFLRNAKALTGLAILAFFLLIAIIGPWIAPYDPSARSDDVLQPP